MPAIHLAAPPATRLRQLLVLLLLALALLAGMSVSQTHALHAEAQQAETTQLPALIALQALLRQVDEQRGIAALHLAERDDAERTELEGRLIAARQASERRLAFVGRLMTDAAGQAHHRTVGQGLAAFWDAQARLLAASRRAAGAADADAAQQARALLNGEAQQAFLRVRADLQAWTSFVEQAAVHQAGQARLAAHLVVQVVWALAALAALALAVGWALLRWPERSLLQRRASDSDDSGLARRLQDRIDPHLQVLNAAVATARRGEPGRAAGLSAQEARHLADQVAAAAQALRRLVDQPGAAAPERPRQGSTDPAAGPLPPR